MSITPERLHKVLARIGIASRRFSEELIAEGRVLVNGEVARVGDKVTSEDEITVDGVTYSHQVDLVYFLLNKPAGYISASSDDRGRKVVTELVDSAHRIFPVGRLDYETEGLLLLTNDGDLTYRLTHPSFGVEKEYLAYLESTPTPGDLKRLRDGLELDDGPTAPAKATSPADRLLKLTIHEGRNRQVRRMCDAIGRPCLRLVRTRIGSLADPKLAPGEYRQLMQDEVNDLQKSITTIRHNG